MNSGLDLAHADPAQLKDREFMLAKIRESHEALLHVDPELAADRAFALQAIRECATPPVHPDSLDPTFNSMYLSGIKKLLKAHRADAEVMIAAMERSQPSTAREIMVTADHTLWSNEYFLGKVAELQPSAVFVNGDVKVLKEHPDIITTALQNDGLALGISENFANSKPDDSLPDPELYIKQGKALAFVAENLDFVRAAVAQNPDAIKYAQLSAADSAKLHESMPHPQADGIATDDAAHTGKGLAGSGIPKPAVGSHSSAQAIGNQGEAKNSIG